MIARLAALSFVGAVLAATAGHGQNMSRDWAFGVEVRERVQYLNNLDFNATTPGDGWLWTQRLAAHAEGKLAPALRARVNLQSALKSGAQNSSVDSNVFDIREAFVDIGSEDLFVRLGRQELILGSQRLIGSRDGTNVRRGWDGVRGVYQNGAWRIDALAMALVEVDPDGVFDDQADESRLLGGVYATGPAPLGKIDLYALYSEADNRRTIEGLANQQRYSFGVRSFGERGPVFWNWEAIYQFGRHGAADISAWTLATSTAYRFDVAWSPQIELSANVASGDDTRGDGELGTFDALYPRGNYFSDAAILGPANFYNFNPYLRLSPTDRLDLSFDVNWFWRLEDADGIYGPPGNILRAPSGSRAGFVSTGLSAGAAYRLAENLSLELIYAHNAPGDFIAETGADDPVDFLELTLRVSL